MKKIICLILSFVMLICLLAVPIYADSKNIDITSTGVRADLASMGEDKLSCLSDTYCIFIAMSQYYDLSGNLRSYLYFNLPTWALKYQDGLCVSISTAVSDANYNITESFTNYDLRYVNHESTWYKFEILGLPNIDKTTRRYNIAEIIAKDAQTSLNFYVEETYIFHGIENDRIEVFNQEVETITITDKEVKFYCYGDGETLFFRETNIMQPNDIYTDAWYIFFNTDKKMDQLLEVELTYQQYNYHFYQTMLGVIKDDEVTEAAIEEMKNANSIFLSDFNSGRSYVNYLDKEVSVISPGTTKVGYTDKGWFGSYDTYYEELDNIMDLRAYKAQSGDEFVFSDYADKYAWGVHFKDTSRSFEDWATSNLDLASNLDGCGMSDVAILRLKFQTNGIVKNCYAIDDPTDDFTGGSVDVDTKFEDLFEKMFMLIGMVVLVVLAGYLLPVFNFVFEGVTIVLSFPFKIMSRWFSGKNR